MTVSSSVTLRKLAEAATPGPWEQPEQGPRFALSVFARGHVVATAERVGRGKHDARLIALAPALAVGLADAIDALERARDTAQLVANGCDTGHLDFTIDDTEALLARLGDLVGQERGER